MNRQDYEDRIMRVIAYIEAHLAEDLSLDTLADVAALSRFHFHRVFRGLAGETVSARVRRLRLHRAAARLLLRKSREMWAMTTCPASPARLPPPMAIHRQSSGMAGG